MNLLLKAILLAAPWLQIPNSDQPRPQLTVVLLNGTNGKPIPNARLLVFAGATTDDVRFHKREFDLRTDKEGIALVPPGQMWPAALQIFVDFMTVCQPEPNLHSFSLPEAMNSGLVAPNSCGSVKITAKPGQLTLFARKPTLRERTAW